MYGKKQQGYMVWYCKIGAKVDHPLELNRMKGADFPMRAAVSRQFVELTGLSEYHCFSGWGSRFSAEELCIINDDSPSELDRKNLELVNWLREKLAAAKDEKEIEHYNRLLDLVDSYI